MLGDQEIDRVEEVRTEVGRPLCDSLEDEWKHLIATLRVQMTSSSAQRGTASTQLLAVPPIHKIERSMRKCNSNPQ